MKGGEWRVEGSDSDRGHVGGGGGGGRCRIGWVRIWQGEPRGRTYGGVCCCSPVGERQNRKNEQIMSLENPSPGSILEYTTKFCSDSHS